VLPLRRRSLVGFGCSVHRPQIGLQTWGSGGSISCSPSTRTGRVVSAIAVVEGEVRELVRRRGMDPVEQPAAVRRPVDEVIADYDERSISGVLTLLLDTSSAA
jgi:hypothetical protein